MCGIAGFFSLDNQTNQTDLLSMTGAISHRGPDAEGTFLRYPVGLGHRRLSIIDLSEAANQPMFSHSGNSVMVFNGEIYNYKELARELGITPRTHSDSEIILEAFEKLGPDFVSKLNGMFAIAIYDIPRRKLFLFRDRLGIKPLFYFQSGDTFLFASELKSLKQVGLFQKEKGLNYDSIAQFLHFGYVPGQETMYQNTYKFPQGCYGEFNGKSLYLTPYWELKNQIKPNAITNEHEALEQLKELVNSSVRYRLIADVPYGSFLSGGIDSSLVSAVAQRESNHQLKTFSIGFAETRNNEAPFAKAVAQNIGTDHHEFILTEQDALGLVESIWDYYDEPFGDSSAIPTMLVSEMARRYVTMTVSGDGGDELFHGYGMYRWARRLNNPLVKALRYPIAYGLNNGSSRYKRIAGMFNFSAGDSIMSHIFSQEQYFFSSDEVKKVADMNIRKLDYPSEFSRKLTPAEKQAFYDLQYYLPDDLLVKVDRASMKYALETRVPLLDYRIVEFALNLHPGLKVQGKTEKYLLKKLLWQYVPEELFNRPKWGFSIPLEKWMRNNLKYLADNYLSTEVVSRCALVQVSEVERLKDLFYNQNQGYLYNRLWALIQLHKWFLEKF